MGYPTQGGTLARLEAETRKAGRAHEDACLDLLAASWGRTKDGLRGLVMNEYRRKWGGRTWTLPGSGQVLAMIYHLSGGTLTQFYHEARAIIEKSVRESYRLEALRQVWMLDMLTPPSYKPKIPARALREAGAQNYAVSWEQALGEWIRAYQSNFMTNLRLEALHEGGMDDAAGEVDAAKIDGFDPGYKFSSALTNQILQAQSDARGDVADSNDDIVAEEIFQTMEDERVCEDCDSMDGQPVEDAEPIPVHFNCRCFQRIVPSDFAELLRNGTDEEKQAALDADARGLVPDSMAIYDPETHQLKAHIHVFFDAWAQQQDISISGGE